MAAVDDEPLRGDARLPAVESARERGRFERAVDGVGTSQTDCAISGLDINRTHILRAWVRWLGTSDEWTEYGSKSVEVGYAVFLEADGSLEPHPRQQGRAGDVASPWWLLEARLLEGRI